MWVGLFFLGTAIWVLVDAKSIGVRKGLVKGAFNMGPWAWFFVVVFLWIVGFPCYLAARGKFKRAIADEQAAAAAASARPRNQLPTVSIDDLEKLAALRDKGVITEEEFALKKKQALSS